MQARLLHVLLDAVEADLRWDALELGCSLAAGRGDALSDVDVGLWPGGVERPSDEDVTAMVRSLGAVVDLSAQPWGDVPRWWVQYADGTQVDLVVLPVDGRRWRAPGSVVLLDRSGRLAQVDRPSVLRAGTDDARGWMLDGWEALSNVAKYVQRGSLLEAQEQLHRARTRVYQLWAIGQDVDYPTFGLTSLLDAPGAALPHDIEATYCPAEEGAVRDAALRLTRLISEAAQRADPHLQTPLASYVTERISGTYQSPGSRSRLDVPTDGPLPATSEMCSGRRE